MTNPTDPAGSHHGDPLLTYGDMKLLQCMTKWIEIVRREYSHANDRHRARGAVFDLHPNPEMWLPSYVDMLKSRLFWRLRTGKEPLKFAPPRCWSCPWYELIEDVRPHWCFDGHVHLEGMGESTKPFISLGQDRYDIETWDSENHKGVVNYEGNYRFNIWYGTQDCPSYDTVTKKAYMKPVPGWWIELIVE